MSKSNKKKASKKNVSKKNVSKKIQKKNDEHDFELKIDEIKQELKDNYIQQKKLMNDLKELMSSHKKEIKLTTKSKNGINSGKQSGFNKPEPIPVPLKKLLKIKEEVMPRSKITVLMYQYFTDNNMYDTTTKKEIIPNKKIKEIFGVKKNDVINFYNLQTWLKKVYDENPVTDLMSQIEN